MFESLNEIDGLTEDHISAIKEKLTPSIESHVKSSHGKTFGAIDDIVKTFTGVEKSEKQLTSEYARNALKLWNESNSQNIKKELSTSWEQEKAGYLEAIEKAKDSDKIYADYQSVKQANSELMENHKLEIEELSKAKDKELSLLRIDSLLPKELNTPLLAPWKSVVSNMLIEKNIEIKGGEVQACEATGGINIPVNEFIVQAIPELKDAFATADSGNNVESNSVKIPAHSARTTGELTELIRQNVMKKFNITNTDPSYSARFTEEEKKYKSEFERLKRQ